VRKLNSSRAHQRYRKIYKTGVAPNEIIRIKKLDQSEKRLRGIRLTNSVNPQSTRYIGANTGFTYVCGTTEVHRHGTPEVLFTAQRCIRHVNGTLVV
jgi:hypothetical protein